MGNSSRESTRENAACRNFETRIRPRSAVFLSPKRPLEKSSFDFPAIHYFPKIKRGFFLRNNGAHNVIRKEDVELACYIRRHILKRWVALRGFGYFLPELNNNGIVAVRELEIAEFGIRKDTWNFNESRAALRIFDNQLYGIAIVLFEHRAERFRHISVELTENPIHLIYYECFHLGPRAVILKHVETHWPRRVGRIEVNDVIYSLRRHSCQNIFYVVSVRIYKSDALAVFDVLNEHVLEHPRLSGSRLKRHVSMPQAVRRIKTHRALFRAIAIQTNRDTLVRHIHRRWCLLRKTSLQFTRCRNTFCREVEHGRYFHQRKRDSVR